MVYFLIQAEKKGLLLRELFVIVTIVVLLFLVFGVTRVPVSAASIIIAAADASSQWKSEATVVCTGTSDQSKINTYLTAGNTVQLSPGTFNINNNITPGNSTHLYGQGNTTILNLQGAGINVWDVSNIEIDHLKIAGATDWNVINAAVFIRAQSANITNINIHDILCTATGGDHVDIYTASKQISNLVFSNIDANNPAGYGFMIMTAGPNSTVTNVTFYKCSVENAGVAHGTSNTWTTGFDFADYASSGDLTVSNLYAINCSVNGAWESGFHMEGSPVKQNIVITGCNAQNCGQKPNALYGAGYLINGDTVVYNNTASGNKKADLLLYAAPITPIQNGISLPTSTKTASAINQGNCSGVMINIDATHKELVLYSNDGNPVSQQLELGGNYTSADGNTYSFNGTKLIAQFTNYAIMNLVASTTTALSVTTSSLPNGIVGVAYSQTLAVTGGTAPYTWTITSGTLPTGLSLSSSGVLSGTPTIGGGPTTVTFKVTDSTSTTATKSLSITVGFASWDVNKDGIINVLDMVSISQHLEESGTPGWIPQDVNGDGIINTLDMIIIGQHWTG